MLRKSAFLLLIALAGCQGLEPSSGTTGTTTGGTSTGGTSTGGTSGGTAGTTYNGPTTRFLGRSADPVGSNTLLAWSDSGVETRWTGSTISASLTLVGNVDVVYFDVYVDGALQPTPILVTKGVTSYTVKAGSNGTHTVRLVKRTEAGLGEVQFGGFTPDSGSLMATAAPLTRRIEVIGDSISCGYGVMGFTSADNSNNTCPTDNSNFYLEAAFENSDQAYGTLLGQTLGADVTIVAWSGKGVYRNDDASTTQTVPDLYPYNDFSDSSNPSSAWSFPAANTPDVVVINLGTNDFSASSTANVPQAAFVNAYKTFVQYLRSKYPDAQIVLVGGGPMLSDFYPTGLSQATTSAAYVQAVVTQLGDPKVTFVKVATQDTTQGTGCLSHPLPAEHKAMAQQLAGVIQPLMNW